MKQLEIEVEKVNGHCSAGYKLGDKILVNGFKTPDGFCGGAYTTLFPIIVALSSGAQFSYEKNPHCKTHMACPDNGHIIFKVTALQP